MRLYQILMVGLLVISSWESCSEKNEEAIEVKVVKVITNYPSKECPDWYNPPPNLEFVFRAKNFGNSSIAIPVNQREDFTDHKNTFFNLNAGCEKYQSKIFLFSPVETNGFILIDANETKLFSLQSRFQQLDSLFEKCGFGSMYKFLLDTATKSRITYSDKDSKDVVIDGKPFKVLKHLKIKRSERMQIEEPSNLEGE